MTTVISLASRRAAPTTTPTTGNPDPVQLYGDAQNALAMALRHLRAPSGNVPGAARKTVQALSALRRLQQVLAANTPPEPFNPCTGCKDNFQLPTGPMDIFDQWALQGQIARRTACTLCPSAAKPCLAQKGGAA